MKRVKFRPPPQQQIPPVLNVPQRLVFRGKNKKATDEKTHSQNQKTNHHRQRVCAEKPRRHSGFEC